MNLFKWLINDLKEDFKVLKELAKGEYKSRYTLKELFTVDWKDFMKKYWLWFLLIILAFCVGYLFCANQLQDACNQFIINNDLVVRPAYDLMKGIAEKINITNITIMR